MYKKNSLKNLFLFLLSISIGFQAIAMQRYAGGPDSFGDDSGYRVYGEDSNFRMQGLLFNKNLSDYSSCAKSEMHEKRFIKQVMKKRLSERRFLLDTEIESIFKETMPSLKTKKRVSKKEENRAPTSSIETSDANQNYFTPDEPVFFDQVAVENPDQVVDGIVVIINAAKKLPSFVRTVVNFDFPTEKIVGLALIAHCVKNMF